MLGLPYIFKKAGWIGGTFVTLSFSSVGKFSSLSTVINSFGARGPVCTF